MLVRAFISYCLDYCNSLRYGISNGLLRLLQSVQNAAARLITGTLVILTTLHQCYGSYTSCQSVSKLCSRSRGSCISRSLEQLPCTSLTTVAFCRTLVVAHCGPIPMTCGSCLCREHLINLVIGVSAPLVLDCGTIFHPDYGGRDCPSIPSNMLSSLSRLKRLVILLNL